jgi:hypothetical protein
MGSLGTGDSLDGDDEGAIDRPVGCATLLSGMLDTVGGGGAGATMSAGGAGAAAGAAVSAALIEGPIEDPAGFTEPRAVDGRCARGECNGESEGCAMCDRAVFGLLKGRLLEGRKESSHARGGGGGQTARFHMLRPS